MTDQMPPLTDLERRVYRAQLAAFQESFPSKRVDQRMLVAMAKAAVQELTTGSASGRRIRERGRRLPDPGATPERIRYLARQIEGSYHTMPNGWVRADDQLGTRYE